MPRKWRFTPEERALRAIQRMSLGGHMESSAPVKGGLSKESLALAAGAASAVDQVPWQEFLGGVPGTVVLTSGKPGVERHYMGFDGSVGWARASLDKVAIGTTIVDVLKNGSTIFTTSSNRIQIGSGAYTNLAAGIDVPAFAVGDYFTFDVVQLGSIDPGSDLTVQIGGLPILGDPAAVGSVPTFSPADVGGMVVWLKADAILASNVVGGSLVDNAQINTWPDSSGHARNFTGQSITSKPQYKTSVLNGLPGVRFDGGATMGGMSGPDLSAVMASAGTMFVVWKFYTASEPFSAYVLFTSDHESGAGHHHDQWWRFGTDTAGYWSTLRTARIAGYPGGGVMPTGGSHYLSLLSGASTYRIYLDGADQGAQSGSYEAPVEPVIGYPTSGTWNAFFNGWVCEFLLYDSVLSSTDRANVESYLKARYGL